MQNEIVSKQASTSTYFQLLHLKKTLQKALKNKDIKGCILVVKKLQKLDVEKKHLEKACLAPVLERTVKGFPNDKSRTRELRTDARRLVKGWKKLVLHNHGLDKVDEIGSDSEAMSEVKEEEEEETGEEEEENEGTKGFDKTKNKRPEITMRERKNMRQVILRALAVPNASSKAKERKENGEGGGGEEEERKRLKNSREVSTKIESTLFELFSNDRDYRERIRVLSSYIGEEKNGSLRQELLSETLSPKELLDMKDKELMEPEMRSWIDSRERSALDDAQRRSSKTSEEQQTTDLFKCSKCHQRRTTYYQLQTRSADEPLTTFITCLNCGNKWKQY